LKIEIKNVSDTSDVKVVEITKIDMDIIGYDSIIVFTLDNGEKLEFAGEDLARAVTALTS